MNKQDKGNGNIGIGWCDYTWNPIGGCQHGCQWQMPDGAIASCYAESAAESVRRQTQGSLYPQGFAHHYWTPERLKEPTTVKSPSRIFVGSMSDVFGHWVPAEQIQAVLDACAAAPWHTFQFLTKNAPRLLQFTFPDNAWVGVSVPPTFFRGHRLSAMQQEKMLKKSLDVLSQVKAPVRWMSIEPLSWDVSGFLNPAPLEWVVLGAASHGATYYQPDLKHLTRVMNILDDQSIPIYFKSNLRPSASKVSDRWREDFPIHVARQLSLFGEIV